MKKRKLNKDIRKSITHSWGRFISIMLLMALGSFALIGLAVTGPDMRKTGVNYFSELNAADITVLSDYGIDKSEQEYIEKASDIKNVEYIYLKDVTIENTNKSIRIFSKPKEISLYELVDGKFPTDDTEIAISSSYKNDYNIGDTLSFEEQEDTAGNKVLKTHEFKIVGFINSTEILSNLNLGQTTVGTGELNGYAIVNNTVFDSDVYMMAKITFNDTQNLDPYSDEYNDKIQLHKDELNKLLEEQQDIRLSGIKADQQTKIDDGEKELNDAKQKLEDARNQLNDANTQLENAKQEIKDNESKLNEAKNQINSSEKTITQKEQELNSKKIEYNKKLKEYNEKKQEIANAEKQINSSQNEINKNNSALEDGKKQYEDGINTLNLAILKCDNLLQNEGLPETQKNEIIAQKEAYIAKLNKTKSEYDTFINGQYKTGKEAVEQAQRNLDSKKSEFNTAKQQLEEANNQLNSAKKQLSSGENSLKSAKNKLASGKKEYNQNVKKLEDAKLELQEKEKEYNEKLQEFNDKEPDAQKEINDNEKKLNDAKEKLEKLSLPTYSIDNRRELPGGEGYSIYETVSEIVDSLAKVFPVFLYFVAALVTLTTMTRFVGDERINSGTLKSLGYTDRDVIKKFAVYGLIAGMTGTALGVVLGHILIPNIVYNAYKAGFTIPKIELHFYLGFTLLAIALSLISSVLPAIIVTKKELQDTTASLLQPKSPKAGTKILLERIKPIWSKMKFTQKVTSRNIFRYKQRMFMTIFGVAGAASILFAGFSVQSSISGINERQFKHIIKYNAIIATNDDLTNEQTEELQNLLNSEEVKSNESVYYEEVSKKAGKNNDNQPIKLIVPENQDKFDDYISLIDRKIGQKINLEDDGVVISERLATLLNVKVGDSFTFNDSNNKEKNVKVSGICEMYAGHFIFMNKQMYKNIYNKEFEVNAKLVLFNDSDIENVKNESAKFMKLDAVKGVVQNTTLYNQINTIVESLNKIMLVLIIVASLLAVVILYNLTNINVAERIRELCTIKVLGFYDNETTMYIYRETIFLSALGIIVGWIIGILLHSYILNVVPPDQVMFNPTIWIGSYIIPFIVITAVTFVLKYYVNNKLKNVDMLEALKSVD